MSAAKATQRYQGWEVLAAKIRAPGEEHVSSKLLNSWCLKPLSVPGPSFRACESLPLSPEEKFFGKQHPRVPCLLTSTGFENKIIPHTYRDIFLLTADSVDSAWVLKVRLVFLLLRYC